jgi:hypothetical protein
LFSAGLGELVEDADIFSYHDVPHFPISTAPGNSFYLDVPSPSRNAVQQTKNYFSVANCASQNKLALSQTSLGLDK